MLLDNYFVKKAKRKRVWVIKCGYEFYILWVRVFRGSSGTSVLVNANDLSQVIPKNFRFKIINWIKSI